MCKHYLFEEEPLMVDDLLPATGSVLSRKGIVPSAGTRSLCSHEARILRCDAAALLCLPPAQQLPHSGSI